MILISHRGNINGPHPKQENNPNYLKKIADLGYNVEIDVWKIDEKLFLGHDDPTYQVSLNFLKNDKFWCHAKNLESLKALLDNDIVCFWHQNDDFTLTSNGYIWTYPRKEVCEKTIIVCHTIEETIRISQMDVSGICSDYVGVL